MGIASPKINALMVWICFIPIFALAQKPSITSIAPTSAGFGETITINGSNLTGGSATVFFGGVLSPSVTVQGNTLVAQVPAGALKGPVTVLNNGLSTQSSAIFYPAFGGQTVPVLAAADTIDITSTNARNIFDICMCDINGDGRNDVVVTHENFDGTENNLAEYTYFINTTTTPATTTFSGPVTVNLGGSFSNIDGFVSVKCADLDNDGSAEFVFVGSESLQNPIFIFDDITSQTSTTQLELPRASNNDIRDPRGLEISDIDRDGRMDIIVGNGTDNSLHIFKNNGGLNFDVAQEWVVSSETGSIAVGDLNNDLLPDIAIVPFGASNESIYLLRNNSIPGTISFLSQDPIPNPGQRRNIVIGDFNNDGLADLATTTNGANEEVEVFENTSTVSGDLSFTLAAEIIVSSNIAWGIDAGDINGDGLLDIAVSDVGSGGFGEVYVLENTTTSSLSFNAPIAGGIDKNARNIVIGDLNGDAKPDLAYSHNVSQGETDGELGFNINNTCITPKISPQLSVYCPNENFTVEAQKTPNGTYNWSTVAGGTPVSTFENTATFNIAGTSNQTVEVQIIQTGCAAPITSQISLTSASATAPAKPLLTVNDNSGATPICEGDEVSLSTDPAESYLWTLPDGTTSTNQTLTFSSISSEDAGVYSLRISESGSCLSDTSNITLQVETIPTPVIFSDSELIYCDDNTNQAPTLEVEDVGASYQWRRDGTDIAGATAVSFVPDQSGTYVLQATSASGCSKVSNEVNVQAVPPPASIPSGPTETCREVVTSFTAASTGATGFDLEYTWRVDSSGITLASGTGAALDYSFQSSTPFDYDVILTTNYPNDQVNGCADEQTLAVSVSPPPTMTFDTQSGTQKCAAESLDVSVTNTGVSSYSWSIRNANASGDLIDSNAGINSTLSVTTSPDVDSVYAIAVIQTTIGCTVRDSLLIRNFPSLADIQSSAYPAILATDSAVLEDGISIELSALNIVSGFSWEPSGQIDNPNAAIVNFFPQGSTNTATVTGLDTDGCLVASSVVVELDNLRPKKTFSPNGDGMNDCWEILNIGDQGNTLENQCEVYIFDSRGKNIGVFDDFNAGENCVWDGNSQSSPVPEGVYYYVLKCTNQSFSKTGSILLAR